MECPECHKGQLKVINTYQSGDRAKFQRVQCDTCRATGTVQQVLVNINPIHGQGASALAKKAEKEKI